MRNLNRVFKDIEGFSHLILLHVFNRSGGYDVVFLPCFKDKHHGVFTTRAPNRPNPIGLSVVRLEMTVNPILYITEMDILDGTPLLFRTSSPSSRNSTTGKMFAKDG